MLNLLSFFLFITCNPACQKAELSTPNTEASKAFEYLNQIRASPHSFSKTIGVDLAKVEARPALTWNNTLAIVAQRKAEDMAKRKYVNHTDPDGNGINILIHNAGYSLPESWITPKSTNYFESIGAGYPNGIALINSLILDKGQNPPGHRNHLLGISDFWKNCEDIGIGFAFEENSPFGAYACIIIAKHDF